MQESEGEQSSSAGSGPPTADLPKLPYAGPAAAAAAGLAVDAFVTSKDA